MGGRRGVDNKAFSFLSLHDADGQMAPEGPFPQISHEVTSTPRGEIYSRPKKQTLHLCTPHTEGKSTATTSKDLALQSGICVITSLSRRFQRIVRRRPAYPSSCSCEAPRPSLRGADARRAPKPKAPVRSSKICEAPFCPT